MKKEKLLQNPLPINHVAARVVTSARPENLWSPKIKVAEGFKESSNVLKTAPIPNGATKGLSEVIGKRRDRMVIIGYAEDQGSGKRRGKGGAKWVVRCDCGKYEQRSNILRWLGTSANDMCRDCHNRKYILGGWAVSKPPAERCTKVLA